MPRTCACCARPRPPSRIRKSSVYGRHLSPDEVRTLVAPGYQDLDAVLAFLRDAGLTVDGVAGARTAVQGHGPAEKVSRAFDVPIGTYDLPRAAVAAHARGPSRPSGTPRFRRRSRP